MAIQILMPALSPTMTDGTLAKWLVSEGDSVSSGDVIAEIETDKATMEVEALDDGIIAKILVSEATQNVAVNTVIALMTEEGESLSDADLASASASAPASAAPAPASSATPTPVAEAPVVVPVLSPATPSPAPQAAVSVPSQAGNTGRIFASPLARRIAAQNGIDIAALAGTGPHGRIIKADVDEALSQGAVPAQQGRATASGASAPRFVPHTAMRRVIAQRLQSSKQTAPHFYLTVECEIDSLLAARKQLNEFAPEGIKISVNDMIIKAAGYALMAEPDMNGFYSEEGCSYYDTADICMAVAVDGGLVTPVIHSVEKAGLAEIAGITADLASRARQGKLDPSDYAGGNFTISNLGMFGIKEFSAVINPPQSGILAIGAGEQRPIVKSGELAIATMMSVTLSADHRIVDGAVGARWLQAFKRAIETPAMMLL